MNCLEVPPTQNLPFDLDLYYPCSDNLCYNFLNKNIHIRMLNHVGVSESRALAIGNTRQKMNLLTKMEKIGKKFLMENTKNYPVLFSWTSKILP